MKCKDLNRAERYKLVGHLLHKGIKKDLVDPLFKILNKKNTIDNTIDELMNLIHRGEDKEEQEIIDEEINSIKQTSQTSMPKKGTIVVGEKKPYFTSLLKQENIAQNYYIIHVENGVNGLKTMKKLMPSIAIIDFDTYSILDQYESIKIIREQYEDIPIFLLCNIIPDTIKDTINQHDMVSYIQKPINGRYLQELIEQKIRK